MPQKIKIFGIILILIAFGFTTYRFNRRMPPRNYCDFHLWYTTGERMLNHQNVYILKDQTAAEFRYPPPAAVMMMPLALFNKHTAGILWHILNFWLLVLSFILIARIVIDKPLSGGKMFSFYFILAFLLGRIISYNFDEGQVNIILLTLALLSVYYAGKNKDFTSGVFLGISWMMKYMSFLLWPYFLIRRRYKIAVVSCLAAIALLFLSLPLVGYHGFSGAINFVKNMIPYMHESSFAGKVPFYMDYKNFGFLRLMYLYFTYTSYNIHFIALSRTAVNLIILFVITSLYLFVFWKPKLSFLNTKRLEAVDFGFIFLFMAYFNPNAWLNAYIFLLVPYAVVIYYLINVKFRDVWVIIATLISYVLISFLSRSMLGDKLNFELSYRCLSATGVLPLLFCLVKIKLNKTFLENRS